MNMTKSKKVDTLGLVALIIAGLFLASLCPLTLAIIGFVGLFVFFIGVVLLLDNVDSSSLSKYKNKPPMGGMGMGFNPTNVGSSSFSKCKNKPPMGGMSMGMGFNPANDIFSAMKTAKPEQTGTFIVDEARGLLQKQCSDECMSYAKDKDYAKKLADALQVDVNHLYEVNSSNIEVLLAEGHLYPVVNEKDFELTNIGLELDVIVELAEARGLNCPRYNLIIEDGLFTFYRLIHLKDEDKYFVYSNKRDLIEQFNYVQYVKL